MVKYGGKSDILRSLWKSKLNFILIIFIILTLIPMLSSVIGDPFEDTTLSIRPVSQIVDAKENFTIDVYCNPGQPIKAYEFRLSYDEALLTANLVTEGNIFEK